MSSWSNGGNWGGTAPSGSGGTLDFPALTGPACTVNPPTATCYRSSNDLSGLSVNALSIDDGVGYQISGNAITLGAGGITASPSGAGPNALLGIPITLGASQTWSITDSTGAQGLTFGASVSGATSALAVSFGGIFPILSLDGADVEVGPVSVTGGGATNAGTVLLGSHDAGSLNGTDGNPVSLSDITVSSVKGAIGPLTLVGGGVFLMGAPGGGAGALAVDGGVAFDSMSGLAALIAHPGTVIGTDYSQLSASGTVSLAPMRTAERGAPRAPRPFRALAGEHHPSERWSRLCSGVRARRRPGLQVAERHGVLGLAGGDAG